MNPGRAQANPGVTHALWSKLAAAGLTTGEMPGAETAHTPWYVRAMLGIAGWIAALFLLGFVGAGFAFVVDNKGASMGVGLAVVGGAYAVFRAAPRSDFGAMFALAVSFAGQALFAYGLWRVFERGDAMLFWVAAALAEAALAFLMPNFIHRAVSAYVAGFALAQALGAADARAAAGGILAAMVAGVWLNEGRLGKLAAVAIPAGYGLTLAFIQVEAMTLFFRSTLGLFRDTRASISLGSMWLEEGLVAAALLASVAALLRRAGGSRGEPRTLLALLGAIAIGAASLKAPGVSGGLMIVLLGFANGNRVLTGLGIAGLLFYVCGYYYLLDMTLLLKSGVLAATGAALLAARWLALNVVMAKPSDDA